MCSSWTIRSAPFKDQGLPFFSPLGCEWHERGEEWDEEIHGCAGEWDIVLLEVMEAK